MPLAKVQDIAKGRVWSGADARGNGLVDELGGFWTAADTAKRLAGIAPDTRPVFKLFPRQKGLFDALGEFFGGSPAAVRAIQGFVTLMNAAPTQAVIGAVDQLPRGGVELRATNLPR